MQFAQHSTTNRILGAPQGHDHSKGEVLPLPVTVYPETDAQHGRIVSYWRPTDAEKEAIAGGALLELSVFGRSLPPVSLGVEGVEHKLEDAPVSLDAFMANPKLRELMTSAVMGAITFGFQGSDEAPADHWLRPFWELGRGTGEQIDGLEKTATEAIGSAYRGGVLEGGSKVFNAIMEHPSNEGRGIELFQELKTTADNAIAMDVVPVDPDEQPLWEALIENAFWDLDARVKGYGPHAGKVQAQRAAFFAAIRGMLVKKLAAPDEENMRLRQLLCDVFSALGAGVEVLPAAPLATFVNAPKEVEAMALQSAHLTHRAATVVRSAIEQGAPVHTIEQAWEWAMQKVSCA